MQIPTRSNQPFLELPYLRLTPHRVTNPPPKAAACIPGSFGQRGKKQSIQFCGDNIEQTSLYNYISLYIIISNESIFVQILSHTCHIISSKITSFPPITYCTNYIHIVCTHTAYPNTHLDLAYHPKLQHFVAPDKETLFQRSWKWNSSSTAPVSTSMIVPGKSTHSWTWKKSTVSSSPYQNQLETVEMGYTSLRCPSPTGGFAWGHRFLSNLPPKGSNKKTLRWGSPWRQKGTTEKSAHLKPSISRSTTKNMVFFRTPPSAKKGLKSNCPLPLGTMF